MCYQTIYQSCSQDRQWQDQDQGQDHCWLDQDQHQDCTKPVSSALETETYDTHHTNKWASLQTMFQQLSNESIVALFCSTYDNRKALIVSASLYWQCPCYLVSSIQFRPLPSELIWCVRKWCCRAESSVQSRTVVITLCPSVQNTVITLQLQQSVIECISQLRALGVFI